MGLLKTYHENFFKIQWLMGGIAATLIGLFLLIKFNQIMAGTVVIILGIIMTVISIGFFNK